MSRLFNSHRKAVAGAILALCFVAAVDAAGLADPIPAPITDQKGVTVKLVSVADGLIAPNCGTYAPGRPDELYVVVQTGQIWVIDLKRRGRRLFLDASHRLVSVGAFGPGTYDERGLLGLAFHPDYKRNGLLYTFGSEPPSTTSDFPVPLGAAANTHSTVVEWHVTSPTTDGAMVDPGSARVVMSWAKPQFNHNGGAIAFGPDGLLYASSRADGIIYRIAPDGTFTVYAEGLGIATGIAFDREGNLFVGDRSGTIFKVAPPGSAPAASLSGIGAPAGPQIFVFATLEPSIAAYHLAFNSAGTLFVTGPTTSSNQTIHAIDREGTPSVFYSGLGRAQGLAFDRDDNLYVAASLHGSRGIVRIAPEKPAAKPQAEVAISGNNLVGLAFIPGGAAVLATRDALFHIELGIHGRTLP